MKKIYDKNGFTMTELVMVIVVLGILAALAMPRMDRDRRQEAADTILADIRYAQHMALNDYRENHTDPNWQRTFWRVQIEGCADNGMFISVGADIDKDGSLDQAETLLDPANGKPMFWDNRQPCEEGGNSTVSPNIFLYKKFGIDSIVGGAGCKDIQHIGFDHLGRPHVSFTQSNQPDYSSYMNQDCVMTFTVKGDDNFSIIINQETGYAHILNQNAS